MAIIYRNVDQGSLAWNKLRQGIPTASMFDKILTPKKLEISEQRKSYACRLIAERLLNWQADTLDHITHIEEGKRQEPLAVKQLEFTVGVETTPLGFVMTDDKRFGASPDRAIGVHETHMDTCLEVKAPTIPMQVHRLLFGHDDAYRCQCQGQLYVCEADKAIFYSYNERMPPYLIETGRDEAFISKLAAALNQFSDELEAWTEKARCLGAWEAFQEVVSPTDATYGPGATDELAKILEDGL